jgi:YegS/Rv2252/BmrU family lipid kinase
MKVTIIANPIAGNKKQSDLRIADNLLRSQGIIPEIRQTGKRGDACLFAQDAVQKKTDIVMAAGGDGTINEVANGLVGSTVKLAVLPRGTANVFSREATIPSDPHAAVDLLFTGTVRHINLGLIRYRDRYHEHEITKHFILMAGIGFDGGVLSEIKRSSIARWGRAAYVFKGIRALSQYTHSQISITVDQGKTLQGYSAVIGNALYYGGKFIVTPHASLLDDSLELCVFRNKGSWAMGKNVIRLLMKNYGSSRDLCYCKARSIHVTSSDEVFIQADGDFMGTLPAYISVSKTTLPVIVPEANN